MTGIESYWKQKSNNLIWGKKPKNILKKIKNRNYWFDDGKLNIAENCLLNKSNKNKDKTALIFISNSKKIKKISYSQLTNKVQEFSLLIESLEIKEKKKN